MTTDLLTRQQQSARMLLLALVGGIVLGIVAMHGLSQTHSHPTPALASSAAPVQDPTTQAMPAMVAGEGGHKGHESPGHGIDCDLVACCLIVIFGGALLLWTLLAHRRPRRSVWIKRVSTTAWSHVSSLRRPPDLIGVSILRC